MGNGLHPLKFPGTQLFFAALDLYYPVAEISMRIRNKIAEKYGMGLNIWTFRWTLKRPMKYTKYKTDYKSRQKHISLVRWGKYHMHDLAPSLQWVSNRCTLWGCTDRSLNILVSRAGMKLWTVVMCDSLWCTPPRMMAPWQGRIFPQYWSFVKVVRWSSADSL